MNFVLAGLLLGLLMASMDNTIVATAMGTIVGELGGLDKFVWVTSAYMVATMAGMPIFGKLSDMYGRKRFYVFGLIVFLLGSILCGTANSIVELSIYRAIQGIGGGALMPIAFTIIFDVFPPEKRGKMTGLFGAVFGTSSVFGPLLGAYHRVHRLALDLLHQRADRGALPLFHFGVLQGIAGASKAKHRLVGSDHPRGSCRQLDVCPGARRQSIHVGIGANTGLAHELPCSVSPVFMDRNESGRADPIVCDVQAPFVCGQ